VFRHMSLVPLLSATVVLSGVSGCPDPLEGLGEAIANFCSSEGERCDAFRCCDGLSCQANPNAGSEPYDRVICLPAGAWQGTVTSSVDGEPIAHANVQMLVENADGSISDLCGSEGDCPTIRRTDSEGFYTIPWKLNCPVAGDLPHFLQACHFNATYYSPACDDWRESERVYVTCEPAVQEGINFVLDPVAPSAAQ